MRADEGKKERREPLSVGPGDLGQFASSPSKTGAPSGADAQPAVPDLSADQIIAERYRVKSLIASGGMGSVYRVEHVTLRKEYALKTLNPNNVSSSVWLRFQKEAHAASLLDHPILVKVHDFGIIDERQPYFVMDLFEGETLAHRLKASGPLSIDQGLSLFIEVCFGLAYAHSQGVIHRDIKPSNIMLSEVDKTTGQPQIRIVDFGIAKLVNVEESDSLSLTRTGEIFGTPYYMSPEQCMGTKLDHRSDIYSLGCVMFESFTGLPPCLGDSALAIMMKHQFEQPPTLKEASLGKDFPDALEKIIGKMIAKKPEHRYQNLLDVANDLNGVKMGRRVDVKDQARTRLAQPANARTMRLFTAAGMALLAVVVGFTLGRITTNTTAATSTASADPSAQSKQQKFYSELSGSNDRIFHFPSEHDGIGSLINPAPQVTKFVEMPANSVIQTVTTEASGDILVTNFQPLAYSPNRVCCEHPEILKNFRQGEITAIDGRSNIYVNDAFLRQVSELSAVRSVDISHISTFSDKGIAYVGNMPNLVALDVSETATTPDGLRKMKNLLHIQKLHAERIKGLHPLLSDLKESQALEQLALRETGLTDQDILAVSQIKTLKQVDLSANDKVTDLGVKYLTAIPQLEELSITGWHLTPNCIPYLKMFHNLRKLAIHKDQWKDAEIARLKAALGPHVEISWHHIRYAT